MTTIIIVVVVALVFFVALCVVTFMVWKREEEMRTDSLRSIEVNLQELGHRMSGDFSRLHSRRRQQYDDDYDSIPYRESRTPRNRTQDPFEWTRADSDFAASAAGAANGRQNLTNDDRHVAQKELEAYEGVYANGKAPASDHVSEGKGDANAGANGVAAAVSEPVQTSDQEPKAETEASGTPGAKEAFDSAVTTAEGTAGLKQPEEKTVVAEGLSSSKESKESDDPAHFGAVADVRDSGIRPDGEQNETGVISNPEELDDFESFEEYAEQLDMEALRNSLAGDVDSSETEQAASKSAKSEADVNKAVTAGSKIATGSIKSEEDSGADGYVADYIPVNTVSQKEPAGHDTGRSGKKYTAEELDLLIRE